MKMMKNKKAQNGGVCKLIENNLKHTQLTFVDATDSFLVESLDSRSLSANWPMESRPFQGNRRVSNDSHRTPATPTCVRPLSL